jgi:hypothetical protein
MVRQEFDDRAFQRLVVLDAGRAFCLSKFFIVFLYTLSAATFEGNSGGNFDPGKGYVEKEPPYRIRNLLLQRHLRTCRQAPSPRPSVN